MAIKTFTEAARGRKKCPADGCPHYVAAVTKKCPCGHEFVRGTKPKPVATKVAAKLAVAAGTQKPKRKRKPEPEPEPQVEPTLFPRDRGGVGMMRTAIPAGACPSKLKSTDQSEVYAWILRVCKAKEDERTMLMASALKYYAREFYECVGKTGEYDLVCQHIDSYWLGEGIDPPDQYELDDDDESDEVADTPVQETKTKETEEEDFDWE